jgi:hypothetical protein
MDHLPGAGLRREQLPAQPPIQCCQFFRRLTLYSQRIFTLDVAQNALRVLLRRFLHVRLPKRTSLFSI